MGNRGRSDIIADILTALEKPELKTLVMYKCRLSYNQLKSYQKILTEKGLLEEKNGRWVSTDRGRTYLRAYRTVAGIIRETC